jgi:two-component system CheB/CheR fusion protein
MPRKKLLPSKKAIAPPKPAQKSRLPKVKDSSFCIAGIGASAGGLEAFEQFFSSSLRTAMSDSSWSHLDPSHTSMLPELLERFTTMAVRTIVRPAWAQAG